MTTWNGELFILDYGRNTKVGEYVDLGFFWPEREKLEPFVKQHVQLDFLVKGVFLASGKTEARFHFTSKAPWFRLEIENAELFSGYESSIISARLSLITDDEQAEPIAPQQKPGKGPYGEAWNAIYKLGWWHCADVPPLFGTDAKYLDWLEGGQCACRDEHCQGDIVAAHVRRIAKGAGTNIKPEYSAIPLCDAHHRKQHQHGESAIGGKEHVDKLAARYKTEWMESRIRALFEVTSLSQIHPSSFRQWVMNLSEDAHKALPTSFRL